jgi:hypothetical protein
VRNPVLGQSFFCIAGRSSLPSVTQLFKTLITSGTSDLRDFLRLLWVFKSKDQMIKLGYLTYVQEIMFISKKGLLETAEHRKSGKIRKIN